MARILLGVTGGISAYKAVELTRLAGKAGHSVRVLQTERSLEFVGRATFEGITGAPVLIDEFERDPAGGAFPGDPAPGTGAPRRPLRDRTGVGEHDREAGLWAGRQPPDLGRIGCHLPDPGGP